MSDLPFLRFRYEELSGLPVKMTKRVILLRMRYSQPAGLAHSVCIRFASTALILKNRMNLDRMGLLQPNPFQGSGD